ncbi:MAG: hypothetical protein ROO73_02260 [Roseivirga sp.]
MERIAWSTQQASSKGELLLFLEPLERFLAQACRFLHKVDASVEL